MNAIYKKSSEYPEVPLDKLTREYYLDGIGVFNGRVDNIRIKIDTLIAFLSSIGIGGSSGNKDPYDIAVEEGFVGSRQQWLTSLIGKSAYKIAQDHGFVGSEEEFLLSLIGPSAYQLAVKNGFKGSEQDFLNSLKGENLYQLALKNGFVGSESDFILSLKGPSAYQVAVDKGFQGDEQAWFNFLKGPKGDIGPAWNILGSLDGLEDLPDPSSYNDADGFFVNGVLYLVKGGQYLTGIDLKGPPGKDGSSWIIEPRDPLASDGVSKDYFLNSTNSKYYLKDQNGVWVLIGTLLEDTLKAPPSDDKYKCLKNGEWVDIPAPTFDKYSLAVKALTPSDSVMDLSRYNSFTLLGSVNHTLTFSNIPSNRSLHVDILILGSGGIITFPNELTGTWDQDNLLELNTTRTQVTVSIINGTILTSKFAGI